VDGPLTEAGLNQPSGLATDGELLYFADSEASAIRSAGLDPSETVDTIVGVGLFEFGDGEGTREQVRLQHPLGVEYGQGVLYIADTYNNKIKYINPVNWESRTIVGSGKSGWLDGSGSEAEFDEPGGLSYAAGRLYVADTNNHVIRVVELISSEVSTLPLKDPGGRLYQRASGSVEDTVVTLSPITIEAGPSILTLVLTLPEGHRFNHVAPLSIRWSSDGVEFSQSKMSITEPVFPIEVLVDVAPAATEVSAEMVIYYCRYDAFKLRLIHDVVLDVPLHVLPEGGNNIELECRVGDLREF
jgi:hypothetical protein